MKVRFTPHARAEFLGALNYIRRDDPAAARRFRKKAERALRRLARYPDSGRRLPECSDLPVREVIVSPYRFFYRKEGKTVWIVAVLHGSQQPRKP